MRVPFACVLLLAGCSTDFVPQTVRRRQRLRRRSRLRDTTAHPVCVHAEDAPLIIGQSAPISGHEPGARHRHEARHRARVRRAERDGRHSRPQARSSTFRDDAYQPEPRRDGRARAGRRAGSTTESPKCPSTMTPSPGNAPVSTTALAARPERGARAARQRRHADDGARRAGRGRDRHACSSARSPAPRRSCATRTCGRVQQVHLQRPRELRPGGARDDRVSRRRASPTTRTSISLRPERLVRPGRLRRSRRRRTRT